MKGKPLRKTDIMCHGMKVVRAGQREGQREGQIGQVREYCRYRIFH